MSEARRLTLAGVAALAWCASSPALATSITSATIDWSSLHILRDGVDVTNSLTWVSQSDTIGTSYLAGALTGVPKTASHDIASNPSFAVSQSTVDGALATQATTHVDSNTISVGTQAGYTGKATSSVDRFAEFLATPGTYTFSVEYSLSAYVDGNNSQTGGPTALNSTPYAEFDVTTVNPAKQVQQFYFTYDDTVSVNGLGSMQNAGMFSAVTDFNSNPIVITSAGSLIQLDGNVKADSSSFSNVAAPVPLPPSAYLMVSGVALLGAQRRRRNREPAVG